MDREEPRRFLATWFFWVDCLLLRRLLTSLRSGVVTALRCQTLEFGLFMFGLCGDGGFMMNSQELETAVRLKLDLVVLVLRDNACGRIEMRRDRSDQVQRKPETQHSAMVGLWLCPWGAVGLYFGDSKEHKLCEWRDQQ